jgi:hypothetical protein
VFYYFVYGNGGVELRPAADEPVIQSQLPPRTAERGETQSTRRISVKRRRNRPMGGYHPFEKTRSYLVSFVSIIVVGLVSLVVVLYVKKMDDLGKTGGRKGPSAMEGDMEVKKKDFQKRQQEALAKRKLMEQQANVQPSEAKVEDRPQPDNPSNP